MPWSTSDRYPFTETSILVSAPELPGVYSLHREESWIYIGESGNIKSSLLDRLRGDSACITLWRPDYFSYEFCPAALRVARQRELILENRPVCN